MKFAEAEKIRLQQQREDKKLYDKHINNIVADQNKAIEVLTASHKRQTRDLLIKHRKELEMLEESKNAEIKRLHKEYIPELLSKRAEKIKRLKTDLSIMEKKMAAYRKAYKTYKSLRQHLLAISDKNSEASEKFSILFKEMYSVISSIEDGLAFHLRSMKKIGPKIERAMEMTEDIDESPKSNNVKEIREAQ